MTGSRALFGDGEHDRPRSIKAAIHDEVGLTASVGVGSTKLVAKIASRARKPDGLVVVPPGGEAAFLAPLADLAAVGRGRQDGRGAARLRGRHDRRPRGARPPTRSCGGSASTAAPLVDRAVGRDPDPGRDGRPGEVDRARAHLRRRHRQTATRSSGRCWAWPMASRGGCGRPASRRSTVTLKLRDSSFTDDHAPDRRSRSRPT